MKAKHLTQEPFFMTKNGLGILVLHAVSLMFAFQSILALPVLAYKHGAFPNRGSRQAWEHALHEYNDGVADRDARRFEDAIKKFNAAIGIYPYDSQFYLGLGSVYDVRRAPGDLAKSESACRKAIALNPSDWWPWNDLAEVLYLQNRKQEAVTIFEKALRLGPPTKNAAVIEDNLRQIKSELNSRATQSCAR